MLTLLTFAGSFGIPSHSPFCVKAMCQLRLSGQPWQPEYIANPSKMPHGRLPVLRAGDRLIPDSSNIQAYLEEQGTDFNPGLNDAQKAASHMLITMVEESLRHGLVYDRWLRNDCWPHVREAFFGSIPQPLRLPITAMIRGKVRKGLTSQGIAQFPPKDRLARMRRDLDALSVQLGQQDFLFGPQPTAADTIAAPVLDMIRALPCDTDLRRLVRENAALVAYVERARDALYPQ